MGVAAIAFVAVVGFNALGAAQGIYWGAQGAPAQQLNPPPPPAGAFIHPTTITISSANCDQGIPYLSGQSISCTATVTDVYATNREAPQGQVSWYVTADTAESPVTCNLTPVAADASTCTFNHQWTVAEAAPPGSDTVRAVYNHRTSNHLQSSSATLTFTVSPPYEFDFACNNPWVPGFTYTVAVGQPLWCSLTVADQLTHAGVGGVFVTVSAKPGSGQAYFSCYTNDDPNIPTRHAAAYASMTATDPTANTALTAAAVANKLPLPLSNYSANCQTQPGQQFTCVTLSNGLCVNNLSDASSTPTQYTTTFCPAGACSFVYRRNYDDLGVTSYPSTDVLTATAPMVNEHGSSPTISLQPDVAHGTATIVQCSFGTPPQPPSSISIHGGLVNTDTLISSSSHVDIAGSCAAAVFDTGPNTAFDYHNCIPLFTFPDGVHCQIDDEKPRAPLGQVMFNVYTDPSEPSPNYGTHAGPPIASYACNLGHVASPVAYIAGLHPLGPWFHASWCSSQTMPVPVGTTLYVDTIYAGNSMDAPTDMRGIIGLPTLETVITVS